jgi:branched-chain amino acid transport system permease protein
MDAGFIVQILLDGLTIGSTYVLLAAGLVLMFGVLKVVNFAHGQVYMVGAYVVYSFVTLVSANFFLALGAAMATLLVVGMLFEKLVFYPLRKSALPQFVASIGLILILQNIVIYIFSSNTRRIPPFFVGSFELPFNVRISIAQVAIVMISAAVFILVYAFVEKTRVGMSIRAVAQDSELASMVGVNVKSVRLMVMGVVSGVAGMSGGLMGALYNVNPQMGTILFVIFCVVTVGGMSSLKGSMVAGLALGIAENLFGGFVDYRYTAILVYAIILGVLWTKPSGLFGEATTR